MKLLVTGFEPFGGSAVNPSAQIVSALATTTITGIELVSVLLPVDRARAPAALVVALADNLPDVVLCLGQANGRVGLSVERVAINLLDFSIADNAGGLVADEPVVPGAPAAYFVTLPVKLMVNAVREVGVPCESSLSAGTFICNQVLFCALHYAATRMPALRAGFIHVPALPQQVAERSGAASMSLETMLVGVRAAIDTLAACTTR